MSKLNDTTAVFPCSLMTLAEPRASHCQTGTRPIPAWSRLVLAAVMTVVLAGWAGQDQALNAQPRIRYPGLTFHLAEPGNIEPAEEAEDADPQAPLASSYLLESDREALEEAYGPFAEEHLGALTELAEALQQEGNNEQAITELEEALQIARIQFGLNAPEQLPVVNSLIENQLELKNYDDVDDLETLHLHVIRQLFQEGSDTYNQALTRNALWNMEYFQNNYLYLHQAGNLETSVSVRFNDNSLSTDGIFGNPGAALNSGGIPPVVIQSSRNISQESSRLNDAEDLFESILENPASSDDSKLEAIDELLSIIWLRNQELYLYRRYIQLDRPAVITYRDAFVMESRHYREGLNLLEQKLEILEEDEQRTVEEIAQAHLDTGDWYLAFNRGTPGKESYRLAWQTLVAEGSGFTEDEANSFMNPSVALMLPAFVTHQFDQTWMEPIENVSGFIEIELDLPDDGIARRTSIEGHSEGTPIPLRHVLRNYVRNATFRPKLVNGETVEQRDLLVRYNYYY